MILLKRDERGPTVVALQILLNRQGGNLVVDGVFGPLTKTAVIAFQRRHSLADDGDVGKNTWSLLVKGTGLRVVDIIDVCDPYLHEEEEQLKAEGAKPIPIACMENGVQHSVSQLIDHVQKRGVVALLRFRGHAGPDVIIVGGGTRGGWAQEHFSAISPTTLPTLKPILMRLKPFFAPFGSVELHNCSVGANTRFLHELVDIWGVPVTAPRFKTLSGGFLRLKEAVLRPLGDRRSLVDTAYPGWRKLASWAKIQSDREAERRMVH